MSEKTLSFNELSQEQQKEFEELAEEYVSILHKVNLFISNNNVEYDEVWDKANQAYDDDLTYAPNDEE